MDFTELLIRKFKLQKLIIYDAYKQKPTEYFTCLFRRTHVPKYIPSTLYPAYISTTQRQSAIYEVLQTTEFGQVSKGEVGINRLLKDGYFSDAFPLHDGPFNDGDDNNQSGNSNPRRELYVNWAQYSKWYKFQPIDNIRDYFGEKIGLYFAWLGAYAHWLLIPSIVGLVIFLISLTYLNNDSYSEQVCTLGKNITMCPDCDGSCNYWNLSDSCFQSRLSAVVDNQYTIFYAIFMTIWGKP